MIQASESHPQRNDPLRGQPQRILSLLLVLGVLVGNVAAEEALYDLRANLVYAKQGDKELTADVWIPKGKGPFPGVLMVHGGAWMSGSKLHLTTTAKYFAQRGYTVCNINYRLAPKYKFPAQIEDCTAALRYFRQHAKEYKLMPGKVAGYGYSAGAHLVCLLGMMPEQSKAASQPSTRLQAIVSGGTPCDFRSLPESNKGLVYWLGATRGEQPALYESASPMHFLSSDDPTMFFFHGRDDRIVPMKGLTKMRTELDRLKIRYEVLEMPNKNHFTAFLSTQGMKAAHRYLDQVFKPKPAE